MQVIFTRTVCAWLPVWIITKYEDTGILDLNINVYIGQMRFNNRNYLFISSHNHSGQFHSIHYSGQYAPNNWKIILNSIHTSWAWRLLRGRWTYDKACIIIAARYFLEIERERCLIRRPAKTEKKQQNVYIIRRVAKPWLFPPSNYHPRLLNLINHLNWLMTWVSTMTYLLFICIYVLFLILFIIYVSTLIYVGKLNSNRNSSIQLVSLCRFQILEIDRDF